jgi:hypothetical protein
MSFSHFPQRSKASHKTKYRRRNKMSKRKLDSPAFFDLTCDTVEPVDANAAPSVPEQSLVPATKKIRPSRISTDVGEMKPAAKTKSEQTKSAFKSSLPGLASFKPALTSSNTAVASSTVAKRPDTAKHISRMSRKSTLQTSAKTISLNLPPGTEVEDWPHLDRVAASKSGKICSPGSFHVVRRKDNGVGYMLPKTVTGDQVRLFITPYKKCGGKCGKVKDSFEFPMNRKRLDYLETQCKVCYNNKQKESRYKVDDYDELMKAQDYRCAVCNDPFTRRGEKEWKNGTGNKCPAVDHNHFNGEANKLLCQTCNRAEGLLGRQVKNSIGMVHYMCQKYPEQLANIGQATAALVDFLTGIAENTANQDDENLSSGKHDDESSSE